MPGLQGRSREVAKAWSKRRNEGACRWAVSFDSGCRFLCPSICAVCWTRVSASTAGHTMTANKPKQMLSRRDKLRVFLSNNIPDVHLGGLFRVAPVPAIAGKAARMSRGTNHRICLVHCVCRESRKGGGTWAACISTIPLSPLSPETLLKPVSSDAAVLLQLTHAGRVSIREAHAEVCVGRRHRHPRVGKAPLLIGG